jgi:hypothetical protein
MENKQTINCENWYGGRSTLTTRVYEKAIFLGCVVVSGFVAGPKVRGFKHGLGQWICNGDKTRSTTFFRGGGGGVKTVGPIS